MNIIWSRIYFLKFESKRTGKGEKSQSTIRRVLSSESGRSAFSGGLEAGLVAFSVGICPGAEVAILVLKFCIFSISRLENPRDFGALGVNAKTIELLNINTHFLSGLNS